MRRYQAERAKERKKKHKDSLTEEYTLQVNGPKFLRVFHRLPLLFHCLFLFCLRLLSYLFTFIPGQCAFIWAAERVSCELCEGME